MILLCRSFKLRVVHVLRTVAPKISVSPLTLYVSHISVKVIIIRPDQYSKIAFLECSVARR